MNSRRHKPGTVTYIVVAAAIGILAWLMLDHAPVDSFAAVSDELRQRRLQYLEHWADRNGFLAAAGDDEVVLRLCNPRSTVVTLAELPILPRLDVADQRLEGSAQLPPEERALLLLEIVRRLAVARLPLYRGDEFHEPRRFVATYGAGFCDDMAQTLAVLAAHHGLAARVYSLERHVVTGIELEGTWRIFDAHTLGVVRVGGEIADYSQMVALAKTGSLVALNEVYRSEHDSSFINVTDRSAARGPFLSLLPGEERLFLRRPFVLATDGICLVDLPSRDAFLDHFDGVVANSVRRLALRASHLDTPGGDLTVLDAFPFTAVFLEVKGLVRRPTGRSLPRIRSTELLTTVDGDGSLRLDARWPRGQQDLAFAPEVAASPEPNTWILDFSAGLRHLSPNPTRGIVLSGLGPLLSTAREVLLVTGHPYCFRNLDRSAPALAALRAAGLEVHLPPPSSVDEAEERTRLSLP